MSELGYIEGKTFAMEPRFGDGKDEVLPEWNLSAWVSM
jgi:hypothetical protein